MADGLIHLGGGCQILTDQVQIAELDAAIVVFGLKEVEQRRSAVLVGEGDGVAGAEGELEVACLVGAEQAELAFDGGEGGVDIGVDLRAGRFGAAGLQVDVDKGALFFALVAVEEAKRECSR